MTQDDTDLDRAYTAALDCIYELREPEDALIRDIVDICVRQAVHPAEIVRVHRRLVQSRGATGQEAEWRALSILERTMAAYEPETRQLIHDLRNNTQIISGWLTLLERDMTRTGGRHASKMIERMRRGVQNMITRMDASARDSHAPNPPSENQSTTH